jgi:hypothetical protein
MPARRWWDLHFSWHHLGIHSAQCIKFGVNRNQIHSWPWYYHRFLTLLSWTHQSHKQNWLLQNLSIVKSSSHFLTKDLLNGIYIVCKCKMITWICIRDIEPLIQTFIAKLEKIQKFFTRKALICCQIPYSPYPKRLHLFQLNNLYTHPHLSTFIKFATTVLILTQLIYSNSLLALLDAIHFK